MSTISGENAKKIRKAMEIHVGFSADLEVSLTYTIQGSIAALDNNYSETLEQSSWYFQKLADLANGGFPLDSSIDLYDPTSTGSEQGKIGLISSVGGNLQITVNAQTIMPAITIDFRDSEGTVTANGITYDIQQFTVIPVNARSVTLTITNSSQTKRLQIGSIYAGISATFDTDSIISCDLSLKSDLSPNNPSLPISSIEFTAVYRDDLSAVIGAMPDNAPITYYSGYPGDYSSPRHFYLSEPAQIKDGVIEIHGEDSVRFLDDVDVPYEVFETKGHTAAGNINYWIEKKLKDAGVPVLTYGIAQSGSTSTHTYGLIKSGSLRDHIANIMNLCKTNSYYPRFVDAGDPRLYVSKPTTASYTINESDCGDVETFYDKQIALIKTDDDHGLTATAWANLDSFIEIEYEKKVKAGKKYVVNAEDDTYFYTYYFYGGQTVNKLWQTPVSVAYKPTKTSEKKTISGATAWTNLVSISGAELEITDSAKRITPAVKRTGATLEIEPMFYGVILKDLDTTLYPNYKDLFDRSNETGSFTWKGNPKMQPRDIFNFVRLDGTTEVCTVESIELKHERGGLSATISYRKGIV